MLTTAVGSGEAGLTDKECALEAAAECPCAAACAPLQFTCLLLNPFFTEFCLSFLVVWFF